jgi:hypothetical protein
MIITRAMAGDGETVRRPPSWELHEIILSCRSWLSAPVICPMYRQNRVLASAVDVSLAILWLPRVGPAAGAASAAEDAQPKGRTFKTVAIFRRGIRTGCSGATIKFAGPPATPGGFYFATRSI